MLATLALGGALVVTGSTTSLAHRLNVFFSQEADAIVGQTYFQNGSPAQGAKVQILDSMSRPLAETLTDEDGRFRLPAPPPGTYQLRIDAGWGHGLVQKLEIAELSRKSDAPSAAEVLESYAVDSARKDDKVDDKNSANPDEKLFATELPVSDSKHAGPSTAGGKAESRSGNLPADSDGARLAAAVNANTAELRVLRSELIQMRRTLEGHMQRTRLQDVLGGIGYIIGIMGLLHFLLSFRNSRRQRPV
jgi:nickel transport protein